MALCASRRSGIGRARWEGDRCVMQLGYGTTGAAEGDCKAVAVAQCCLGEMARKGSGWGRMTPARLEPASCRTVMRWPDGRWCSPDNECRHGAWCQVPFGSGRRRMCCTVVCE